jgi:predicted transcriptional regulator
VLLCIAGDPNIRIREIAQAVGITERAVMRIVGELEEAGVIARTRQGRRTHYEINEAMPLRHPIEAKRSVGELMRLIGT